MKQHAGSALPRLPCESILDMPVEVKIAEPLLREISQALSWKCKETWNLLESMAFNSFIFRGATQCS